MRPIKVLHIDDDALFLFLTRKYIEVANLNAELVTFSNGEDAIKYLTDNADQNEVLPDTILVDINMPVMDGWEFVEKYSSLKNKIGKKIKIYLLSSTISPIDIERADALADVIQLLIKPLNKEQLTTLLSERI